MCCCRNAVCWGLRAAAVAQWQGCCAGTGVWTCSRCCHGQHTAWTCAHVCVVLRQVVGIDSDWQLTHCSESLVCSGCWEPQQRSRCMLCAAQQGFTALAAKSLSWIDVGTMFIEGLCSSEREVAVVVQCVKAFHAIWDCLGDTRSCAECMLLRKRPCAAPAAMDCIPQLVHPDCQQLRWTYCQLRCWILQFAHAPAWDSPHHVNHHASLSE